MLVAVDGSEPSGAAIELALRLARTTDGEVIFTHAINTVAVIAGSTRPYGGDPTTALTVLANDECMILSAASARAKQAGIPAQAIPVDGPIASSIVRLAQLKEIDAIVIGTHGRLGLGRFLLGSTAEGVVRAATVPVFVIHEQAPNEGYRAAFKCITVALDDSEVAAAAARAATELARGCGASLVFMHATHGFEKIATCVERARREAMGAGIDSAMLVVQGNAVDAILASAESIGADLIVLGTHSRSGVDRLFLGSVAEGVMRASRLPIMLVPKWAVSGKAAARVAASAGDGQFMASRVAAATPRIAQPWPHGVVRLSSPI